MTIEEYNNIVSKKYSDRNILDSFQYYIYFAESRKKSITNLSEIVSLEIEKSTISKYDLIIKIKERLAIDLKYINDFNKLMSKSKFNTISPQVSANKLAIFIEYALLSNDFIESIINKSILEKLKLDEKNIPPFHLDAEIQDPRSDKTIPAVVIIIMTIIKILNNDNYLELILKYPNYSIYFPYLIPIDVTLEKDSIFYFDKKDSFGMLLIHCGYSFGSSFSNCIIDIEEYKTKESLFSIPLDCAGFLSIILDISPGKTIPPITSEITTIDMYNAHNIILKKDFIDQSLEEKRHDVYEEFINKVSIKPVEKISDIKEGDFVVYRSFSTPNVKYNSLGNSGHCGIVLFTDEKDSIYTINYARDYEKYGSGGFTISSLSMKTINDELHTAFFFTLK